VAKFDSGVKLYDLRASGSSTWKRAPSPVARAAFAKIAT
jgi:predicted metal-binding protein